MVCHSRRHSTEAEMQATGTDHAVFEAGLRREGYQEVTTVEMKPMQVNPTHSHDFDAKALILSGDITITCGSEAKRYVAGDVFQLAAGTPHVEHVGERGVGYLVGRRRAAK
jgi:quercetin dioxygenase-like cupin family protein